MVKFLHQELGFNLVLFESGFGDAALAWEKIDSISTKEFTKSFTSNFYYHSEEIEALVGYVKSQKENHLIIQGFDCQPQQDYLAKRMAELIQAVDTSMAKSVQFELRSFNKLYQFENDKDTIGFNNQRDRFISFITEYDATILNNKAKLLTLGHSEKEISAIKKSIEIFRDTYTQLQFGDMTI